MSNLVGNRVTDIRKMTGEEISAERWIDAHSVTCALCGALADERETINLYEQDTEIEGEAHPDRWNEHDE